MPVGPVVLIRLVIWPKLDGAEMFASGFPY